MRDYSNREYVLVDKAALNAAILGLAIQTSIDTVRWSADGVQCVLKFRAGRIDSDARLSALRALSRMTRTAAVDAMQAVAWATSLPLTPAERAAILGR